MIAKIDGEITPSNAAPTGNRAEVVKRETRPENTRTDPAVSGQTVYGFRLRVDQETKEVTALIIDPETKAVIREIPAKEMKIASDVIRNLVGPLIDKVV